MLDHLPHLLNLVTTYKILSHRFSSIHAHKRSPAMPTHVVVKREGSPNVLRWRIKEIGAENGPNMFSQLEAEIAKYNTSNMNKGGRASIQ